MSELTLSETNTLNARALLRFPVEKILGCEIVQLWLCESPEKRAHQTVESAAK